MKNKNVSQQSKENILKKKRIVNYLKKKNSLEKTL